MQYDTYDPPLPPPPPPPLPLMGDGPPSIRRKKQNKPPQDGVNQYWKSFNTKFPGKVTTVLPDNPYARRKAAKTPTGIIQGQKAVKSYNQAAAECQRDVQRITRECRRVNQKYRDPHFDLELDLKLGNRNCLVGLTRTDDTMKPKGVKRVSEIFEKPQFYIDKATSGDVRQGQDGDCWFMSALSALGTKSGLIDKVCVARDEEVGIYGFVFHRDGEWQQCIVDDKLYLRFPDYDESIEERKIWSNIDRQSDEEEYIKAYQKGSRALYFASCSDENETWLPLLEKAYAKLHGDYLSIESGFVGEAIEDLTGGVTSEIFATDILDKNRFWDEQLSRVNEEFLFGCSTGHFANWLDPTRVVSNFKGIVQKHAYSIIDARTVKGLKLVKLRNPWGEAEWTGPWSDGSKQWTAEWMQLLDHEFGDDGVFWMSYEDLLRKYQHFDRTRLFDSSWTVAQLWTTLNIPWSADYHSTKFSMTVEKKTPVVIVLSQLDTRYFKDLAGQYEFTLSFRVQKDGDDEDDYIVRSHGNIAMKRSVSTDITLEAGTYSVLMKISAWRDETQSTPESVIREWAIDKTDKFIALGLSYDLAHAKGKVVETEEEKLERKAQEKKKQDAERAKYREKAEKRLRKNHEILKKRAARAKRGREKQEQAQQRRAEKANMSARRMMRSPPPMSERGDEAPVAAEVEGSPAEAKSEAEPKPDLEATKESKVEAKAEPDTSKEPAVEAKPESENVKEQAADAKPDLVATEEPEVEATPDPEATKEPEAEAKPEPDATTDNLVHQTSSPETEVNSDSKESKDTSESKENDAGEPSPNPKKTESKPIVESLESVIAGAGSSSNPPSDVKINGETVITDLNPLPTPATTPRPATLNEPDDDALSDVSSFPDFEFDSDIDMSPWPSDESGSESGSDESDVESEDDPWNAVCVVGLRVFSQVKEANVTIQVVRPKQEDGTEAVLDRDNPAKGFVKAPSDTSLTRVDSKDSR